MINTNSTKSWLLIWAFASSPAHARFDDVGFVRALLDDLARHVAYDPARIYATGLSNGAMMSYRLATELPDRMVAIAPSDRMNRLDAVTAFFARAGTPTDAGD